MQPKRTFNLFMGLMKILGVSEELPANPLLYAASEMDDGLDDTQPIRPMIEDDETRPSVVHLRNPAGRVISVTRDSVTHFQLVQMGYTEIDG